MEPTTPEVTANQIACNCGRQLATAQIDLMKAATLDFHLDNPSMFQVKIAWDIAVHAYDNLAAQNWHYAKTFAEAATSYMQASINSKSAWRDIKASGIELAKENAAAEKFGTEYPDITEGAR